MVIVEGCPLSIIMISHCPPPLKKYSEWRPDKRRLTTQTLTKFCNLHTNHVNVTKYGYNESIIYIIYDLVIKRINSDDIHNGSLETRNSGCLTEIYIYPHLSSMNRPKT